MVFVQTVLLPDEAHVMARSAPELAHLRSPVLVMSILGLVPVQVVAVCLWRLLTLVSRDAVFSREAFRWVDTMIGTGIVAALLAIALNVWLVVAGAGQPGVMLFLCVCAAMGAGLALLLFVLRLLLVKAITSQTEARTLHAELDEVI